MAYKYLAVERRGRVAVVTLTNPPYNFLRQGMVHELALLFQALAQDGSIGSVVLTGGVPGYFIAHADLDVVSATRPDNPQARTGLALWHRTFAAMEASPRVVIAAINGQAAGGGCELALACDFRFIARGARIGLIESQLGILPGAGGTQRLTRLLGRGRALELLLEGRLCEADEAVAIGLAHRACEPARLLGEAVEYGQRLASRSPAAVRGIKRCIYEGSELPFQASLRLETEMFLSTMETDWARERLRQAAASYASGHPPAWS
jgi:enoyl-CoA hydratase/carnithine racemase